MKSPKIALIALLLVIGGGAYYYFFYKAPRKLAKPPSLEAVLPKDFRDAMKQGSPQVASTKAEPGAAAPASAVKFTSNGIDQLHAAVPNTSGKPIQFVLKAGEIYESGKNRVVLVEGCDREIPAGATLQLDLHAAALNSSNTATDDPYVKSEATAPQLDPLFQRLQAHPGATPETLRTAVLMAVENPTIDTFAKYPRLHALPGGSFQVATADIINALQLLTDCGVPAPALASDAQLKVEAMIDPQSHDAAMRYYGIAPEEQWAYWKNELLEGNPSLRHYALYGIARYYPDVALQMLPKWATETRLAPIYRLSAVRALAMTHRPEAIAILQQLETKFGPNTDLHQSADRAAKYLSLQLNQPTSS